MAQLSGACAVCPFDAAPLAAAGAPLLVTGAMSGAASGGVWREGDSGFDCGERVEQAAATRLGSAPFSTIQRSDGSEPSTGESMASGGIDRFCKANDDEQHAQQRAPWHGKPIIVARCTRRQHYVYTVANDSELGL